MVIKNQKKKVFFQLDLSLNKAESPILHLVKNTLTPLIYSKHQNAVMFWAYSPDQTWTNTGHGKKKNFRLNVRSEKIRGKQSFFFSSVLGIEASNWVQKKNININLHDVKVQKNSKFFSISHQTRIGPIWCQGGSKNSNIFKKVKIFGVFLSSATKIKHRSYLI